jgi:hypothetical protein
VPRAHQVERRIRGLESADVEDAGQAAAVARHEHVARHEVAMVHDVGGVTARQVPQLRPHPAQPVHVEQPRAADEARFQPLVVIVQVAAAAAAGERPAEGGDRPDADDELGQVACKRRRVARVRVGGDGAGQPRLHRPRQRIARARLAERDRLRGSEPGSSRQLGRCLRLRLERPPHHVDVPGFKREPGRAEVADPEDRVNRPGGGDVPDRQ